ncbi:MAG: GNAT family N-acetyltransferase [Salinivirgaceae bacterium]|nr:GNAT family N-acetyltransferase [Salinivirgaceae bacterium]
MAFLEENCILSVLTEEILAESNPFTCGDDDMDEFFRQDALDYTHFLMGKSYCFRLKDDERTIVACFTISNDSIRIYDLPSSRRNAMWNITNREKMLTRYPGVLIGRLAVANSFSGRGIGSEILNFIRMWFLDESNKTGCRFAIVDAKNEPLILRFYEKNGFKTLFSREIDEDLYTKPVKDETEQAERLQNPRKLKTRLMFCDLLEE